MSYLDHTKSTSSDSGGNPEIWNTIAAPEKFESVLQRSVENPQLIYKHSHRCSICFLAKQELEGIAEEIVDIADLYLVNVIQQRKLSNAIANELNVRHESPQWIILKNKKVIWNESHWEIKGKDIVDELK